jgi:hypothetical protein
VVNGMLTWSGSRHLGARAGQVLQRQPKCGKTAG